MRTTVRIAGTRLWWRHALLVSGAKSPREFTDQFLRYRSAVSGDGLKLSLVRAWASGKHSVSKSWVRRVEREFPGTEYVHRIGGLLQAKRLSAPAALRLMEDHIIILDDGSRGWRFPSGTQPDGRQYTLYPWGDSDELSRRGDLYGVLGMLTHIRVAIAQSQLDALTHHLAYLRESLPNLLSLDWVRPDADRIRQCIESMARTSLYYRICSDMNFPNPARIPVMPAAVE